jgi:hypothetical protein
MKVATLVLAAMLFALASADSAWGLNIGASPSTLDLGEVERGTRHILDFYITTDSPTELVLNLYSSKTPADLFDPAYPRIKYEFDPFRASEEDTAGWVSFIENPVLVRPGRTLFTLKDGTKVLANRRISAILNIPEDAEPGYHLGTIKIRPQVSFQGGGYGISIISQSDLRYAFKVKGRVVRDGYIESMEAGNDGEKITLFTTFVNNGTVSMRVFSNSSIAGDESPTEFLAAKGISEVVGPGTKKNLQAFFYGSSRPGDRIARSSVYWAGGKDYREMVVSVPPRPAAVTGRAPESRRPQLWPLALAIALASLLAYAFRRKG